MKKGVCLVLLAVVLMLSLSSCTILANHMRTMPLIFMEHDGQTYFLTYDGNRQIDLASKTIAKVEIYELPDLDEQKETVRFLEFEEWLAHYNTLENEALQKHLQACELKNRNNSIVYARGYWKDDILTGFVQVYKMPALGRATYAVEEIDHSLLFTYDASTDTFTVTKKIKGAVVVAFDKDTAIYWKQRAYYAYSLQTDEETYLVQDKAYDPGPSSYSIPMIYFNEDMCLFYLYSRPSNLENEKEYVYVFDFADDSFFELTWEDQSTD